MFQIHYKPASECSQAELLEWRRFRVAVAALGGAAAAAAVLTVSGLLAQFPSAAQFVLVCAVCAAVCGACARVFIQIPSPAMQEAMRNIRAAGGSPSGERMIETWN